MTQEFNTTWYQPGEEPNIGLPCPKCDGIIDESKWGGYWCKSCKWKWKPSKFPPKEGGFQKAVPSNLNTEIALIRADLKRILVILEELESKSVIYPKDGGNVANTKQQTTLS